MTAQSPSPDNDPAAVEDAAPSPHAAAPADHALPLVSSADLERDPHGVFRYWRPRSPAIQREDGACLVLRADDVDQLLTDPATRQIDGELYARIRGVPPGPLFDLLTRSLLMSEADAHRRRRAPMSRVLAFQAVDAMREMVRSAAEDLIDGFEPHREADLVAAFCAPLPPLVMSRLLGAPPSEAAAFAGWVHQLAPAFAPVLPGENMDRMVEGASRLTTYVEAALTEAAAGRGPRPALLVNLLAAIDAGALTAQEATAQIVTLIIGASDTTRGAMAIQVSLLLQRSASWRSLGHDPERARAAVAEALRFEPPVGSIPRFSTEDIVLDGAVIPAGRLVSLSTLSAMRDPARFGDPDAFVIGRPDQQRWHMVFGGGAHRCIGEALARLELEEGLMALSRKLPGLRLAGRPVRVEGYAGIRRISDLRVVW